ncbi:hypothetical protein LTR37_009388 [Vermiconidia calcicola]|uniref:Uncharacterized protein n=1 Tax=Vermiconidia calcicola TaxID=1690605 RepID=A0ACC3N974_9PEZI|nr:hypothetical protein LTR37_009388 [Vermiconidia calcicola]
MSSTIARRAGSTALRAPRARTARQQYRRTYAEEARRTDANNNDKNVLQQGARRDPELYTLFAIMSGAFALAGWHFSRNPTSSSSENKVSVVAGSEPWNQGGGEGKYQYHPGGDKSKARKDAPSALNEVIIPGVNLPKDLHERYNKWGKEGY